MSHNLPQSAPSLASRKMQSPSASSTISRPQLISTPGAGPAAAVSAPPTNGPDCVQQNMLINNSSLQVSVTQRQHPSVMAHLAAQQASTMLQQQQQHNHRQDQRLSAGELSCNNGDPQNPYPQYAPVTFFYLKQTARPRSWCLAIVSNKYPTPFKQTHLGLI